MPIIEKPENIVSNKIYIPTREVVEITLRVPYFDGNIYVLISIALLGGSLKNEDSFSD